MNASTGAADGMADEMLFTGLKASALGLLVAWTVAANCLVFVVLYKNPRLQTVPNLLVGNLAFSDVALGLVVLPQSAIYAVAERWLLGELVCEVWLSADILCCTASIWNLSIVGLDRYWAITSPVAYLQKRTTRTAMSLISCVWIVSGLISLAPLLGWKQSAPSGNYQLSADNKSYQCTFLDMPAYTIYSATGSFIVPTLLMFYVYYRIYEAFAKHRARQIYRQKSFKVIRKHIESTILHEISHVLPTSDEFAKEEDEDEEDDEDEDEGESSSGDKRNHVQAIIEEDEDVEFGEKEDGGFGSRRESEQSQQSTTRPKCQDTQQPPKKTTFVPPLAKRRLKRLERASEEFTQKQLSYEKVRRHKHRKEMRALYRKSLKSKPRAICAAKERRGVRVLGIILGCYVICWTPFFLMYMLIQFCRAPCQPNAHVEQFITWLGYSNSAMNPIIYTVFNRDYQTALKRLFSGRGGGGRAVSVRRPQPL